MRHAEAAALFRRPFAPGAIGFRAMTKVPYNSQPYAGAQVAAYIGAQSVIQRLNAVVPGRWRQQFQSMPAEFVPAGTRRSYLACRLIVTLPVEEGGPDVEAVYEDLGEIDPGSLAGVKALYSDARKRAAVAAGIGAYLYTSLEAVVLPIGPQPRQVQCIRRQGKSDLLVLSTETEQWLRNGYATRMSTEAVRRDLGEILAHGEPENGIGQGEVADQAAQPASEPPASEPAAPATQRARRGRHRRLRRPRTRSRVMGASQVADPAVAGSAAGLTSAAQLAARIQIPRRLPPRYDGQPLAHLSHSSVHPILAMPGARAGATTYAGRGARRPGRCSSAVKSTTRSRSTTGGSSSTASASPSTRSRTPSGTAGRPPWRPSASSSGSRGRTTCGEDRAFKLGLDAIELTFKRARSRGSASRVAVQRRVEYPLGPGLEWSVLCFLDLESVRPDAGAASCRSSSTTRSSRTR